MRLDGKRAVITGAGGGIGHALVAAFARAGAGVIGCDREIGMMDGLDLGGRCAFDLAAGDMLVEAAAQLCARHGAPDMLVNNAGFTRGETLATTSDAQIVEEIAINLTGAMRFTQALLPAMAERGGAIVFVSSVNALAHFGNPAYAAAKAGLHAYCRAIAVEAARHGIRVNAVCPGSVRTPAWDHRIAQDPGIVAKTTPFYPLGRLIEPAEVANAVVFLASPLASAITGVALAVDGGLTAGNAGFIDVVLGR